MRVMIVGAGSVGGFYGAHLARAGIDVSFLLRSRTCDAVKSRGLTIRSRGTSFTVHPPVATDAGELAQPDVIILGVKCYDIDQAIAQITPILRENTVILTMQNGIDTEERLTSAVGPDNVVAGVAFIYAKVTEPGVIDHYSRGEVTVGELSGEWSHRVQSISDMFERAGIPCKVSQSIHQVKWQKMCWNVVFNPLTVLLNDRVAKALDHEEILGLIKGIVQETMQVAERFGMLLPPDTPDKVIHTTQAVRDIHTSMFDDWKAGRQTEIEFLNGFIAKQGRAFGIPTPINDTLYRLVKARTTGHSTNQGTLRIEGRVAKPLTLDLRALSQLPQEMQIPNAGPIASAKTSRGVRVQGILDGVTCEDGADHATFHAADDQFSASLTLEHAKAHGIILYEFDGTAIPADKGGPFRLITPGLGDLCANVKHVTRVEITQGPGKDTRPSVKQHA